MDSVITITFGEVAENHVGMQKIGSKYDKGFSKIELETISDEFKSDSYLYYLNDYLPNGMN